MQLHIILYNIILNKSNCIVMLHVLFFFSQDTLKSVHVDGFLFSQAPESFISVIISSNHSMFGLVCFLVARYVYIVCCSSNKQKLIGYLLLGEPPGYECVTANVTICHLVEHMHVIIEFYNLNIVTGQGYMLIIVIVMLL